MHHLLICAGFGALLLLSACAPVPAPSSVARNTCDASEVRVEIPRAKPLQCLSRKFDQPDGSEKTFEIAVPVQSRRQNFSTVCDVPLEPIGDDGPCAKTEMLKDLKLRIRYDAVYKHYHLTLTRPDHTKVLDAVEPKLSRSGPVSYLEYTDKVNRLTYYVYLVDRTPGSDLHQKFYWVEVFDDNNKDPACNLERPAEALKLKDPCDLALLPPPLDEIGIRQTDTGGGYEPPP